MGPRNRPLKGQGTRCWEGEDLEGRVYLMDKQANRSHRKSGQKAALYTFTSPKINGAQPTTLDRPCSKCSFDFI